jgi:hypothetical protein
VINLKTIFSAIAFIALALNVCAAQTLLTMAPAPSWQQAIRRGN